MPLSEKHDNTVKLVSDVFRKTGYEIYLNKPFGPSRRRQYADIVASGVRNAFIVEVKMAPVSSSDVIAMKSFVRSALSEPLLEGKTVRGVIISSGTLDPAKALSSEWDIDVIEGDESPQIQKHLHQLLENR